MPSDPPGEALNMDSAAISPFNSSVTEELHRKHILLL